MSLPDGKPRRLTTDANLPDGSGQPPQWSPSGDWLLLNETVYYVDDGKQRDAKGCAAWSPVTDELVCNDNDDIVVESADGSQLQPLGLNRGGDDLTWSPDGGRLAYVVNGPAEFGHYDDGSVYRTSSLWVVNRDGSDNHALVQTPGTDLDGAQIMIDGWSEDGSELHFFADPFFSASAISDGLPYYEISSDGSALPRLLVDWGHTGLLTQDDFRGGETADDRLLLTSGGYRTTWSNKRIALLDGGDGSLTYLTPPDEAAFSPSLSPDGRMIAYVSAPDIGDVPGGNAARDGMNQRHIWIMDADGSNMRRLTHDEGYREERPIWSSDGTQVLFTRMDGEDDTSVWLADVATGDATKLADISFLAPGDAAPNLLIWFGYFGYVNWDQIVAWWQPLR